MADLSNPLTQIVVGQSQPAVTANNLFDAMSPAALYGQNDLTTSGLTWGYYGGRFRGVDVAHGTIVLPASQANVYIVAALATGVVSQSTGTTNWLDTANYMQLYRAVTGPSTITDWDDHREWLASAGAGPIGSTMDSETVEDIVGNLLTQGGHTNVVVTYNDASPASITLNVTIPPGQTLTQEQIEDYVAGMMRNATGSTFTYDDTSPAGITLRTLQSIQIACSDETTALTAGTAKVTFRMPYAFTLTAVRASLTVAQTGNGGGGIFTVDIHETGTTVLSTKITIDNGELTSTTATPPVISDSSLADDAEIKIDIDQIGDGTAKGLKVALIGYIT